MYTDKWRMGPYWRNYYKQLKKRKLHDCSFVDIS